MTDEECPKCGARFPAEGAWAKRTTTMLVLAPALSDLDTRVRCPRCGEIFSATEIRYLGFLTPTTFKIFVALIMGVILIGTLSLAFA